MAKLLALKKLLYMLPVLVALGAPLALTGCETDGDAEDAGEKVGEAVDDAADDVKDAADELDD